MKKTTLFLTLLLLISAFNLFAQDRGLSIKTHAGLNSTVGKQWAVFIAIDRYQEWGPLKNPVKDAKEIRDILLENYYIDELRELYDQQATGAGIRQLLADLASQTRKDDSVFIFYAGHGYLDRFKTGFWIPVNGGRDLMAQANWIPNIQLRNMLDNLPAKHVFLVSDSCFSGDILDNKKGAPFQIDSNYFRQAYDKVSRQVMTSGASEEVPDDSEFALRLKSGLRRAEGACIDPEYLFYTAGVREVKSTQPMLAPILNGEHQNGGSFLFFRKEANPPPPPVTGQITGSVSVTSDFAGEILIDGLATGVRVKERGNATVSKVSTGNTEVAVKGDNGVITKAQQTVRVLQNQTVAAVIERPAPANFVRIQGGIFMMGSPDSEVNHQSNETQHRVTVSSFYMAKYPVTQKEYQAVIGTNPSSFKGDNLPVECVSWYDAVNYCNRLSQREGLTLAYTVNGENVTPNWGASGYRLPTEAEWEYACRAGTATPFSTGNNITTSQANYDGNYPYNNNTKGTYREKTTAVGSFQPNPWGLYDMHGNVWEWCWDWYRGEYDSGAQTDPRGASSGSFRVLRGGSWDHSAEDARSAYRDGLTPSYRDYNIGFRLVRP